MRPTIRSTTGGACSRDVQQRLSRAAETKTFTCFAHVLAGRRCLCLWRHGGHLIVHYQWEHCWICALMFKSSLRPHGNSRFARCLQGGGVFVNGGTVTISSCTISGNTATWVRAHVQSSHRPDGNIADVLARLSNVHNCRRRTGQLQYVRAAETCNSPSPSWDALLL
jgi:hypothetical protein